MKKTISVLLAFVMVLMLLPASPVSAAAKVPAFTLEIGQSVHTDAYDWDGDESQLTLTNNTYESITIPDNVAVDIVIPEGVHATVNNLWLSPNYNIIGVTISGGGTLTLTSPLTASSGGNLDIYPGTTVNALEGISVSTSGGMDSTITVMGTLNASSSYGAAIYCENLVVLGNIHVSGHTGIKAHAKNPASKAVTFRKGSSLTSACVHAPITVEVPGLELTDPSSVISLSGTMPAGYQLSVIRDWDNGQSLAALVSSDPNTRSVAHAGTVYTHRFVSGGGSIHEGTVPTEDFVYKLILDYMVMEDPDTNAQVTMDGKPLDSSAYTLEKDPADEFGENWILTLKASYLQTLPLQAQPHKLGISYVDHDPGSIATDISATHHDFKLKSDGDQCWEECTICHLERNRQDHNWVQKQDENFHWQECTVCGTERDKHPHTWVTKHDASNHWRECSVCGAKKDEAPHSWDAGVITTQPTCTEKGIKTYTCTVCGQQKTEEVPALGHKWETVWSKDGTNHWHVCAVCGAKKDEAAHTYSPWTVTLEPTFTAAGQQKRVCTVCGHEEMQEIPMRITYPMLEGAERVYQKGSGENVTLRADAPFEKFEGIRMDGETVAPEHYSAQEQGFRLNADYLETLTEGEHRITITYTDGAANAKLTVLAAEPPFSPQTGDQAHPGIYAAVGALALCAMGFLIVFRPGKRKEF